MGKNLNEYKAKIISVAIDNYRGSLNIARDDLNTKIRGAVEFTGDLDKDFSAVMAFLTKLVSEQASSWL